MRRGGSALPRSALLVALSRLRQGWLLRGLQKQYGGALFLRERVAVQTSIRSGMGATTAAAPTTRRRSNPRCAAERGASSRPDAPPLRQDARLLHADGAFRRSATASSGALTCRATLHRVPQALCHAPLRAASRTQALPALSRLTPATRLSSAGLTSVALVNIDPFTLPSS